MINFNLKNFSYLDFLLTITIFFSFYSNKFNQIFVYSIQMKPIYIICSIIFIKYLYDLICKKKKYIFTKSDIIFAFLVIYFLIVSFFQNSLTYNFARQLIGIVIFYQSAQYLLSSYNFFYIFKKYLKVSFFLCKIGILLFICNLIFILFMYFLGKSLFETQNFTEKFINDSGPILKFIFFHLDNTDLRLKSLAGESNSFGILLLPALAYYLFTFYKRKKLDFLFYTTLISCIITFSLYVYVGIIFITIFFLLNKFNFKSIITSIMIIFSILVITYNNESIFKKFSDTIIFFPKVKFYNPDQSLINSQFIYKKKSELNEKQKKFNNINYYELKKIFENKFHRWLIFHHLDLIKRSNKSQKKVVDTDDAYFINGITLNNSSLAILSNYYIYVVSDIKDKIFGTGLGSFEVIKKSRISNFYLPGVKYEIDSLNLGNKDGKFLINRMLIELGFLSYLVIFIFLFLLFFKNKNINKYFAIKSSIVIFLVIKLIHHGNYLQFELFLFLFILYNIIKNYDFRRS